jgi:hypothetical protein
MQRYNKRVLHDKAQELALDHTAKLLCCYTVAFKHSCYNAHVWLIAGSCTTVHRSLS